MKKALAAVLGTITIALAAQLCPAASQAATNSSAPSTTMETSDASSMSEAGSKKDWTVDDIIMAEHADGFRISGTKRHVAYAAGAARRLARFRKNKLTLERYSL